MEIQTAEQLNTKCDKIRETSLKILRGESVPTSEWQEFNNNVREICIYHEEKIDEVFDTLKQDIISNINRTKEKITSINDQSLLEVYVDEWKQFYSACGFLSMGFQAMESEIYTISKIDLKKYDVRIFMLENWNEIIFSEIKNRVEKSLFELIDKERLNGNQEFDLRLLLGVRESFVNLGVVDRADKLYNYRETFEKDYMNAMREFYRIQISDYINRDENFIEYLILTIGKEEAKGKKYLEPDYELEEVLTQCLADVFVSPFKDIFLIEFSRCIHRKDVEKLRFVYFYMNLVFDDSSMHDLLEENIVSICLSEIIDIVDIIPLDLSKYVEKIGDLFNRFYKMVKIVFNDDPTFVISRNKAFNRVVVDDSSKCPELANFCDTLLRKTVLSKKLGLGPSGNVENMLKNVILLVEHIGNKDIFMIYYKSHLARRLILETSADCKHEKMMIEGLKAVMPPEYVNKVVKMFDDVDTSRVLNQDFKKLDRFKDSFFSIKILNSWIWGREISDEISVSLPVELKNYFSEMEVFYLRNCHGRKFSWYHQMSHGTVRFVSLMGVFDLDVTIFQLAVLFALDVDGRISFDELRLATNLSDVELKKTIWSILSVPLMKHKVIICYPEVKAVDGFQNETFFGVNDDFSLIRNGKCLTRGKVNLMGRLQFSR
uniref:Cullin-5 n=1 Tax=Strigamia maritima TaxID=126957 RepID=T1J7E6_STRMM